MEFPGGGGSTARPSGTENPGGWGGQTGKTLRGGVWIFSGTTQYTLNLKTYYLSNFSHTCYMYPKKQLYNAANLFLTNM